MKILSIDDSRSVHAFIDFCLQGTEHTVQHCYNGDEGLSVLRSGKETFDVILLDWEMPGLTGPEVLKEIVKLNLPTPVVMVTTKNELGDISTVLEIGAREYIMKPFTKEILLEKLESVI